MGAKELMYILKLSSFFSCHARERFLLSSCQKPGLVLHVRLTECARLSLGTSLEAVLLRRGTIPLQVSIQLYSPREKQQLADLVDTMISYNLTYRQEKGVDGQYTYVLDPYVLSD